MEIFTLLKTLTKKRLGTTVLFLFAASTLPAQKSLKSVLINHGASSCNGSNAEQQLFVGGVSGNPQLLKTCSNGLPFYSVFTAYNPKDNKVYFADISSSTKKVYAFDYNFSDSISCPSAITPTYTYNDDISQLCFDKHGNNITISHFNKTQGTAKIRQMNITTGDDIPGTRQDLIFPAGNAPNSLAYGDVAYLPNGRIFMTFGNTPSKLYELLNYDMTGPAKAVFLTNLSRPCYSIGYIDGKLMIGGSDNAGCYYFIYNIDSNNVSVPTPFPLGKGTADITHMNVGIGLAKKLIGSTPVNANTQDIIYHVYIRNKGNTDISNLLVQDNLAQVFGVANISNVNVSIVSNPGRIVLNPAYDGINDLNLIKPGQVMSNYPYGTDSLILRIQVRATNLVPDSIYLSSATGSGQIGAGTSLMSVSDSSNNGVASFIDPNGNGISDDINENIPTPFQYQFLLPYTNLSLKAAIVNNDVRLSWHHENEIPVKTFTIEKSIDGKVFTHATTVTANTSERDYSWKESIATTGTLVYYRITATDIFGDKTVSAVVSVKIPGKESLVKTYPNPVQGSLYIEVSADESSAVQVNLYSVSGKIVKSSMLRLNKGHNKLSVDGLQHLPKGLYVVELNYGGKQSRVKIVK